MEKNMSKKSIKLKNIFIIWLIICFIFIFYFIADNIINYFDILLRAIQSAILTILMNSFFLVLPVIKFIENIIRKENMSEIDLKKYKGYFRDILDEYSIAELEYVDNLCCKEKNTIVATLLKLELLGKIKINEKNIEIIDDNINNLKKTEKYIFNSIKNGKVEIDCSGYIEVFAKRECEDDELIQKNSIKERNYKKDIIIGLIGSLFMIYCLEPIQQYLENLLPQTSLNRILIIIFTFIFPLIFCIISPMIKEIYYRIKKDLYIRTKAGEELNEKIEGLKNYIDKYSYIDTKEKEELILWEDYLIYSVIFNMNKKIIEDISNLIDYEFEYGKIYFQDKK